jgi:Holliday junction resolvasome RuvABC endonuclease subunit
MTIISLDFSILYPGVCVCKDFKKWTWIAVVNSNQTKKDLKNIEDLLLKYPSIKILSTLTRREKNQQYHITERNKLVNYLEASGLLIEEIKKNLEPEEDLLVSIEGISFGSKGNALVDISQATGIIKNKIVEEILGGDCSRFFVFSPSELKNAIGCKGNAKKTDVLNRFLEEPGIESVRSSDLYLAIQSEDWIREGDLIRSPIMDMVDSYLGVVKIHQILNKK